MALAADGFAAAGLAAALFRGAGFSGSADCSSSADCWPEPEFSESGVDEPCGVSGAALESAGAGDELAWGAAACDGEAGGCGAGGGGCGDPIAPAEFGRVLCGPPRRNGTAGDLVLV